MEPTNTNQYLAGHSFYAVKSLVTKKRRRGLKYMGQTPIYSIQNRPSITIKRITESTIVDIKNLKYDGLYDTGPNKIPILTQEKD